MHPGLSRPERPRSAPLLVCRWLALLLLARPLLWSEPGYLDAGVCAACHRQIAERYKSSGMARSWRRLTTENAVEDWENKNTFYHQPSDRHYRMFRRNGRFYQRRSQLAGDGAEVNVVESEIEFVLGSGNHARSFIRRTPDGRLLELPVAWYTEKGGFWAMGPGYDRPDHPDHRREIDDNCLFCHNAYPELSRKRIPEGIDCQRCHGPGQEHVRAAAAGGSPASVRQAILNPARLNAERQLEVCMQCHLESTARRLPFSIRRYGRTAFSYRPDEPLREYVLHFERKPGTGEDDRFEVNHAAYRLRQSACFLRSNGKLTCTTCHDPHNAVRGAEAARRVVPVCRSCHSGALENLAHTDHHTSASDCLSCHMPKRRTEDAVHVVMTDHLIQRRLPARDLLGPLNEEHEKSSGRIGRVDLSYPPRPGSAEDLLYLAVAQVTEGANLDEGIALLEQRIAEQQPRQGEFYFELATAKRKAGFYEGAIAIYEEAARRMPGYATGLRDFAQALAESGRLSRAVDVLQSAPADARTLNMLGEFLYRQGRDDQAVQALQRAKLLNLELPEVDVNLGAALFRKRDRAGAERAFREAIRSAPDYPAAHNNLANLLAAAGAFEQARQEYEAALRLDPKQAEAHFNLAALLARHGEAAGAAEHYRSALQLSVSPPLREAARKALLSLESRQ